MVSIRALLSAGMGIAALATGADAKNAKRTSKANNMVPGAYIVEFAENADPSSFYESISSHALAKREMNYSLFKGATIQFNDLNTAEEHAARVAAMPEIRNVFPVKRYGIPAPEVKWRAKVGRDYSQLRKRNTEEDAQLAFSPHVMTGVDLMHKEGYNGTGIKIAVVDSGIDYNHPALGGCFGDGCLVSYGRDLVGADYTGQNTPVPDDDPMDCMGHGTHVAGTIAAQVSENPFGINGAAPGVNLGAYKVLGCNGGVTDDIIIAAFNEAYEAGSDIITTSLGSVIGWSEDPWAVAVQRIVEKGVPCTISVGNDGNMGLWYSSGNGKGVTSIASANNVIIPELLTVSTYRIDNGKDVEFGWVDGSPNAWEGVAHALYAPGLDVSAEGDGCDALPSDTPDLTDYVVLIRQGNCTFDEKAANAAAFGARYLLFYSSDSAVVEASADQVQGIEAIAMTSAGVGAAFVEALADGKEVVVVMTNPDSGDYQLENTPNSKTGGSMSIFTSWAPTYEADIKPQFTTPGGNILSTYPLALGGYARLSGTSMACPLAAAIYALVAQKRGTLDPKELERLLSATAVPLQWNDGQVTYQGYAPVAQQGAGLLDVYAAAFSTSLLSVSNVAWNDSDHFTPEKSFEIRNEGDDDVTFALGSYHAYTAYTYAGADSVDTFPMEVVDTGATLTFDSDQVTVHAGGKATVRVTAEPPSGLDEARLPIWSGWITLNGTDGSALTIPYQGIGGSLRSQKILSDAADGVYLAAGAVGDAVPAAVTEGHVFTLPPQGSTSFANYSVPTVMTELLFGTRLAEMLIVPLQGTDSGVDAKKAKLGRRKNPKPHAETGADDEVPTVGFRGSIGEPAGFAGELRPRGAIVTTWDGSLLGSGDYVNEGRYKFVVRALRIYGDDQGGEEEWDIAETVGFSIKYATSSGA